MGAAKFDVYVGPTDTLRVFTQGYEQNTFDYLFGVDVAKPAYRVAVDAVNAFLTTVNEIGDNASQLGDDSDLGGALFQAAPLPLSTLVGSHSVVSDPMNGTSFFNMDFTVTYVTAPPRLDVNGAPADFGNVCLGSSQEQVVEIFNLGEDPLDISSLSVSGAGFSQVSGPHPLFSVAGGSHADITVRFLPTALTQGNGSLTIVSSDPCQPSLAFSLHGTVTAPAIKATPAVTTFPATVVGCSASQAVTIQNTGPCVLNVSSVTLTGTGYSVSPNLPFSLPSGASTVLTVVFTPTSVARVLPGTLTLNSNDPVHPATVLNFCGEGVPIGMRVLVLQANGTPYATVDQINLTSYGVKPVANAALKNVALKTAASCQPIKYHYETALPATSTSGQRGSSYNLAVKVGKKSQSLSFTLGGCEFRQITITLQ